MNSLKEIIEKKKELAMLIKENMEEEHVSSFEMEELEEFLEDYEKDRIPYNIEVVKEVLEKKRNASLESLEDYPELEEMDFLSKKARTELAKIIKEANRYHGYFVLEDRELAEKKEKVYAFLLKKNIMKEEFEIRCCCEEKMNSVMYPKCNAKLKEKWISDLKKTAETGTRQGLMKSTLSTEGFLCLECEEIITFEEMLKEEIENMMFYSRKIVKKTPIKK